MQMICLDMEGVLVPEIWIEFSKRTGIPELARTTRMQFGRTGGLADLNPSDRMRWHGFCWSSMLAPCPTAGGAGGVACSAGLAVRPGNFWIMTAVSLQLPLQHSVRHA